MKKCPFCGANIEDSARFCLYCMQSLTEKEQILPRHKKKPQYQLIIAVIIIPILMLGAGWLGSRIEPKDELPPDTPSVTEPSHTPAGAVVENLIDSSCTETGSYDEVVYCSECHEEISRTQKTVDQKPHEYTQKITTDTYLQAPADCNNAAVYHYSCSCGAKGDTTFTEGKAKGHTYASTWEKNETHHWHAATCEHTSEKSGEAEHDYGADHICDTCGYSETINVSGITLNFDALSLSINEVKTLTATLTPSNATNQNVTWTTSNDSIVTVDTSGKVTAVGAGTAIITATATDGNKAAQCTIVVSSASGASGSSSSSDSSGSSSSSDSSGSSSSSDSSGASDPSGSSSSSGSASGSTTQCPHTTTKTERKNEVDSTCTATGVYDEVVYCSACGNELSRSTQIIPKKPHTEVIDKGVAATCTNTGLTEGKHCSTCDAVLVAQQTISTTDHTLGEWIIDKDATSTAEGSKHQVCSACGITLRTEVIPTVTGISGSCGENLTWTLNSATGVLTISGSGDMDDYLGTSSKEWLPYKESIKEVIIEDGVTSIGRSAFWQYTSLTSIVIPEGVTSIGNDAFYGCTSLTNVVIPNSITSVGDHAFSRCESLIYNEYDNVYYLGNDVNPYVILLDAKVTDITSCSIHNDTKYIHSAAFYKCQKLESITIPEGVTGMGEQAFDQCASLTSVTLSKSITRFGGYAFRGCASLTSIKYRGNETDWNAITKGSYWDHNIGAYTITYDYADEG